MYIALKNMSINQRARAKSPRSTYCFTLNPDNVERVREKNKNLSAWVDDQFSKEVNMIDFKDHARATWKRWLEIRSEQVQETAKAYPPTEKYRASGDDGVYEIRQYEETDKGVLLFCEYTGKDGSKSSVSGVPPNDLSVITEVGDRP